MSVRRLWTLCALLGVLGCDERPDKIPVEPAKQPKAQKKADEPVVPPAPAVPDRIVSLRKAMDASLNDHAGRLIDRPVLEKAPHYQMTFEVDFDLFTYTGTQKAFITNNEREPLSELRYMLYPNVPELVNGGVSNLIVDEAKVAGVKVWHTLSGPVMSVPLKTPLAPGETVEVDLSFRGVIHRMPEQAADMQSMAVQQMIEMMTGGMHTHQQGHGYGVFSVSGGIISLAMAYPQLAAYDEHGWDVDPGSEIGDRSYFDISHFEVDVIVPDGVQVIASGVHTGEQKGTGRGGVKTTHTFAAAGVREFAMQMSPGYVSASRMVDGVKVNAWFLESHRPAGQATLDVACEALKIFNRDFGPYPYTELDVVEAPLTGGAGGVEFPGMVTIAQMFYGNSGIAVDPQIGATGQQYIEETRAFVVAHEVAHQWWNAVVGSDSKRHPFVDEALANHSAVHYFLTAHGPEAADRQRSLQLALNYHVALMTGAQDRPVDLPVRDFNGMLEYAAMVYAKGAMYYDEVREIMGDRAFLRAIQGYYRRFAFKVARPEDLTQSFVAHTQKPETVKRLTRRWLHESHGAEDIGGMSVVDILGHLGGDAILGQLDPRVRTLIEHKGSGELGKLLNQLVDPEARGEAINHEQIADLLGQLVAADDQEMARMLSASGRLLARLGSGERLRAGELMRELGPDLAGGDRQTQMMLEAMGMMLDALDEPAAQAPPPRPRRQRRQPQPSHPW
ncbi:MAG: M1 family metallopeptidase [Bradymonadia bacterium]